MIKLFNKFLIIFLLIVSSKGFSSEINEKMQLKFNDNKYELKCIEEGISTYLNFNGQQYEAKTKLDNKFSIGKLRDKWDSFVIANPETMSFINENWKDKDKAGYLKSLDTTVFAKIFKNFVRQQNKIK